MMKVIFDSNIWVSFLIGHRLQAMREILNNPDVEVYCCPQLVAEVMDVVGREKIRKYVTHAETADLLRIIRAYCHSVELTRAADSLVRDPKDLYLLSLAETVGADCLVSGDADLLVLGMHKSMRIVKFAEFINLIMSVPSNRK